MDLNSIEITFFSNYMNCLHSRSQALDSWENDINPVSKLFLKTKNQDFFLFIFNKSKSLLPSNS